MGNKYTNANNINTISASDRVYYTKNSEYFQGKIDSILDGKYKEKNSQELLKLQLITKLEKLLANKKDTQFDDPSAENIDKRNTKLSEEKKNSQQTKTRNYPFNKDILRLKAIDIAIGLNNAKLNPTTDPATAAVK